MANYITPTLSDTVWIYDPVGGGVTRTAVVRVTKTTFTLDNNEQYLTNHLPRLVLYGSAGNTRTWGAGPIERLITDDDPRVADALRQGGDKGDPVPNIAHLEPAPTLKD